MVSNVKYEKRIWPRVVSLIAFILMIYAFFSAFVGLRMWGGNKIGVEIVLVRVIITYFIGLVFAISAGTVSEYKLSFSVDSDWFEISVKALPLGYSLVSSVPVISRFYCNGAEIKNLQPKSNTMVDGKNWVSQSAVITLSSGRCIEMIPFQVWVDGILVINQGNQVVSELPPAGNTAGSVMSGNPAENVSGNVAANAVERTAQRTEEEERTTPRQNAPVYFLKCVAGADQGKRYRLTGKHVIGRDAARCDLVLSQGAAEVSRVHCRIEVRQGRIFLTDMGSSNGTFLGDRRVESNVEHVLTIGTTVTLGTAERFVVEKR